MAQQVFFLQSLMVLSVVLAAVAFAYVDARQGQREDARSRSVDVALSIADSPTVVSYTLSLHDALPI